MRMQMETWKLATYLAFTGDALTHSTRKERVMGMMISRERRKAHFEVEFCTKGSPGRLCLRNAVWQLAADRVTVSSRDLTNRLQTDSDSRSIRSAKAGNSMVVTRSKRLVESSIWTRHSTHLLSKEKSGRARTPANTKACAWWNKQRRRFQRVKRRAKYSQEEAACSKGKILDLKS